MEEGRPVPISEARARLPELTHWVMGAPQRVIVIEHRDRKERVVLTSESYLRSLEARAEHAGMRIDEPFRLAGSISTELTDAELEAALARLRQQAAAAAVSRAARLVEE